MKIQKFRIKNYKSIIDSGDCYLEDGITIFAGKNEAGKTSILEALEDFNKNISIRESAKHLFKKETVPNIEITFVLDKNDIKKITKKIGYEPIDKNESKEITLTKTFPKQYSLGKNSFELLFGSLKESTIKKAEEVKKIIQNKIKDESFSEITDFKDGMDFLEKITIAKDVLLKDEKSSKLISLINQLKDFIKKIEEFKNLENYLLETITELIPNFILFNSFEERFPSEISFSEIPNNQIMKDLSDISGLDLEMIQNGQAHEKATHKDDLNIKVKEEYKKFWSQDFTNLHFEWESGKLNFFIKEDGKYYPPEIRSQGKRWHLAFYIRITARSKEDVNNIILIDEPGLFLHSSAQKDILKKLVEISKKNTIIFSTHSPYLLDPEEFERIRLVIRGKIPVVIDLTQIKSTQKIEDFYEEKRHKKNGEKYYKLRKKIGKLEDDELNKIRKILSNSNYNVGTKIEQKIHKIADKETLNPIMTAIGLELSSGIINVDKKNNVICEGQSDVYYLQGLKLLFSHEEINFVFGGGAPNMQFVGTILTGWGCNVIYLYDNDSGYIKAKKKVEKNWLLSMKNIVKVLGEGSAIEDVFSKEDFKTYILEDNNAKISSTNSKFVSKSDKILLSKNFLKHAKKGNISLSQETKHNFEMIINEVSTKFEKLD